MAQLCVPINLRNRPRKINFVILQVNLEDKSEPRYICLLCEKRGDPRSVMVHVTSQNHYFKYIVSFIDHAVPFIVDVFPVSADFSIRFSIRSAVSSELWETF